MSSGSLPFNTYHRTQALGEGSFGSVVTVYNDDGEEFAMKLFVPEDEDDNEEESTLEVGALLEISILRLLREGNGHPNIVPYQPFQASDQPLVIAVGNDKQFAKLATLCGHPEWAEDERFATNAARVANREACIAKVGAVIADLPADHWMEKLLEAGIPAGPINSISEALNDPQAVHRGAKQARGNGALGATPMVGSPIRIDGTRADAELCPPALGEHTDEVLSSYLSEDEMAAFRDRGTLG